MILRRLLVCVGLLFSLVRAEAAHTEVKLILPAEAAKPGDTILVGVDLKMESGWHTYWKNPGEAGQATEIKWQLPPGVTAGEIQWPLPQKLPPADITTYGYEAEVVLLVPLTLGNNLPAGTLPISAKVSWLECKESCIPASADIQGELNIGATAGNPIDNFNAKLLATWQAKVPAKDNNIAAQAWWEKPANGNTRILDLQWTGAADGADFFPASADDNFEVQGATEKISADTGTIRLRKLVKKFSGEWPAEISGVFVTAAGAHEAKISISDSPTAATAGTIASPNTPQPLWRMLIYAFIGGLILNIMPCVLPVIALKILGFVNEAKSSPRHVRVLGLVYGLGVLVSFLVLGAIVIGVKTAGHKAGWGMQFGNPIFLVCLLTLVTLVALNLFGLFEVTLNGGAMNVASDLSTKSGLPGAFFNGVLATALATPCTAPFLSIALGFAFAQSAAVILLIFAMVAAGLAAPYIVLSWNPAWMKFLPKPGAWMEKLKMAMAFPMMLTVVWLFNLAANNYGDRVLWLGIFLVTVAFAMWIFGEFVQRGSKRKTLATIIVLVLLGGSYVFALEKELRWREPLTAVKTNQLAHDTDGIAWQPWSPEAVMQARATGRTVLVDFTADWCLTCQVNKKTSIEVDSVREKIKANNVITLLADYTHFPDAITSELNHFNRAGVPLVLVYPKDASAPVKVLPEVLTPGIVLAALNESSK
jgi:thiol:disulfide interchange protein DsbD